VLGSQALSILAGSQGYPRTVVNGLPKALRYGQNIDPRRAALSVKHWEDFHGTGALATGPSGEGGTYDHEVGTAWREFFSTLPRETRLLDIATGNGVIALMAADYAKEHGLAWSIDGSDLARIDPARHVKDGPQRLAGIRFHPGMPNERLAFDESSFDAVSGHYALEYGDIAATLRAVHPLLRPGGSAQFVLHHAGSPIVQSARVSLEAADQVLQQLRLHRKLHRLVTLEGGNENALRKASEDFVEALRTLKASWAATQAQGGGAHRMYALAIESTQRILEGRRALPGSAVGLEVDRAEEGFRSGARRLSDFIRVAVDDDAMARIAESATTAGFRQVEYSPIALGGTHVVGWQLTMHRP
jgi:ubiquinone/menaquinone biosynthesis C-methylase UbiE